MVERGLLRTADATVTAVAAAAQPFAAAAQCPQRYLRSFLYVYHFRSGFYPLNLHHLFATNAGRRCADFWQHQGAWL